MSTEEHGMQFTEGQPHDKWSATDKRATGQGTVRSGLRSWRRPYQIFLLAGVYIVGNAVTFYVGVVLTLFLGTPSELFGLFFLATPVISVFLIR